MQYMCLLTYKLKVYLDLVWKHLHNRRSHLFLSYTPQSQAHPLCRLDVVCRNKLLRERGTHSKGMDIKCIINNMSLKGEK